MFDFYARISDNMLEEDDWGYYYFFYDRHKDEVFYVGERMPGCYGRPEIAGFNLKQLLEWFRYDGTGQSVECSHDFRRPGEGWHCGFEATAAMFGEE